MSVETAADRTAMLADYGSTVTKADARTVVAMFDNDFLAVDVDESEVESSEPTLLARTADVSSLAHGDTLTISAVNYTVRGIQPDGTGMTQIMLGV
jgi:hypothetical protein